MRASASNVWGTRKDQASSADRMRLAVRFTRTDFRHFDGMPAGFSRFSTLLSSTQNAPDPELLAKARQHLADKRDVRGLAGLRLAKGMSQKELADIIGTSQPRLSTWESGSEKPGFDSIKRLRDALKVTGDAILEAIDG